MHFKNVSLKISLHKLNDEILYILYILYILISHIYFHYSLRKRDKESRYYPAHIRRKEYRT